MPIRKIGFTFIVWLVAGSIIAACGTVATPVYQQAEETHGETTHEETVEQPTQTPIPPTPTEIPPTATPLPPTEVPTEIPTEIPTEAPTEAPAEANSASSDPLFVFVSIADAGHGEQLFLANGCMACHNVASEDMLVGPGLLNVVDHAATRVEGEGPYTYMYNSIRYSQQFVVEGYPANVMPNYDGILSDADIYDLVAYLATLQD